MKMLPTNRGTWRDLAYQAIVRGHLLGPPLPRHPQAGGTIVHCRRGCGYALWHDADQPAPDSEHWHTDMSARYCPNGKPWIARHHARPGTRRRKQPAP